MSRPRIGVFDGHNDLLFQLWRAGDSRGRGFIAGAEHLALTKDRISAGHFIGGLFAVFVPSAGDGDPHAGIAQDKARGAALEMIQIAHSLADNKDSRIRLCLTADDIKTAIKTEHCALMLHLEGAEAISAGLAELPELYQHGIRSVGPLWSRPNIFGHGVPFSFPGSPDTGDGLSDAGRRLVAACDRLGVMLDVSHLNEAGFWDIAKLSTQPLTATHSNAHALCPSPRNLTDRQLAAIAETGGLVGACFATAYLREDGARNPATSIDLILHQLDYLIEKLGAGHVALGSDFDGAVLPLALKDCSLLPSLIHAMLDFGFGAELTQKLASGNWLRHLSAFSGQPQN